MLDAGVSSASTKPLQAVQAPEQLREAPAASPPPPETNLPPEVPAHVAHRGRLRRFVSEVKAVERRLHETMDEPIAARRKLFKAG